MRLTIVVCTYSPQESHFRRTLEAIAALDRGVDGGVDCVIVDNNSVPPVSSVRYVEAFLERNTWARVVREERQGLSYARLRGVAESTGDVIIFFDDDNEPDSMYLMEAQQAFNTHPQVGVWGPGVVEVEFLGAVPEWVDESCRHMFQERHSEHTEYACLRTPWISSYPAGTGQSARREVMQRYAERLADGTCTASDRTGRSLASAGDGQIVHTAVLMDLAAGVCPALKVRHLIPAARCTSDYLARLSYGVTASLLPASVESFPELIGKPEYEPPSWVRYNTHKLIAAIRESGKVCRPLRRVRMAARVGDATGRYVAAGRAVPMWLEREKMRVINS